MIINLSQNSQYHTQRDNKFYPHGTCNTTASINALLASGISFNYPDNVQPEDYLTLILESEEAWEKMKIEYPQFISKGYHPRHVHKMIEWAINEKLLKRQVVRFTTKSTIRDILYHIFHNQGAVNVNGRFTEFGHIVTIVGFKSSQTIKIERPYDIQLDKIEYIFIDDPYGNYFTGYKDFNGNNLKFSLDKLNYLIKEYNNINAKWAYFFYPEGIV
ncbi:MAG: hypothetical protein WHV26_03630 [Spirochaetota bacterium]|jgi:hypothetical protein